jgi:hypothetical protein
MLALLNSSTWAREPLSSDAQCKPMSKNLCLVVHFYMLACFSFSCLPLCSVCFLAEFGVIS